MDSFSLSKIWKKIRKISNFFFLPSFIFILDQPSIGSAVHNQDDEYVYFTTTLQKIFKDKLAPDNSLVLKEKDNVTPGMDKYQVQCLPCSTMKKPKLMNTGNKSKALSNVKAHLKKPSHVNHVSDYLSGKNKETQVERKRKHTELIKERFDFIDKRYPMRSGTKAAIK